MLSPIVLKTIEGGFYTRSKVNNNVLPIVLKIFITMREDIKPGQRSSIRVPLSVMKEVY